MDRFEAIIRSRRARLALAIAMAAAGLWAFAPYVASEVGGEAYVDAPLIRIASPIAGVAAAALPAAGTPIARSRRLRLVTARSLDDGILGALLGEAGALTAAEELARRQIAELAIADRRLAARAGAFGAAAEARLAAAAAAARADVVACTAEARGAALDAGRMAALAGQGFATAAQRDRSAAASAATAARCTALAARRQAADTEARAAAAHLYLAGSAMDASYADQQRDRLLLRRQELESVAADAEARLAELARRIAAERARLARLAAYDAVLPANSVVWSPPLPGGATVAAGTTLVELADCGHRTVVVTLPERRIEAVRPGETVAVRLIGSAQWEAGQVAGVAGAAARRDRAMVAAAGEAPGRALTVEVALPPAGPAAMARRCDVGRLAEVRFPRWQPLRASLFGW